MRTTLSIEDGLLEEAKIRAKKQKTTVGAVVNEALRLGLQHSQVPTSPKSNAPLKTFRGDGLHSGIDLLNSSKLLETMDHS